MAVLEYRLFDEEEQFPVLYSYQEISLREISFRFACDYLVKDSKVFEKTSTAMEEGTAVVYVQAVPEGRAAQFAGTVPSATGEVRVEVREYQEGLVDYPLVHTFHFRDAVEALLHLQSDYLEIDGGEWMKTSTEIDENRQTYVIYAGRVE